MYHNNFRDFAEWENFIYKMHYLPFPLVYLLYGYEYKYIMPLYIVRRYTIILFTGWGEGGESGTELCTVSNFRWRRRSKWCGGRVWYWKNIFMLLNWEEEVGGGDTTESGWLQNIYLINPFAEKEEEDDYDKVGQLCVQREEERIRHGLLQSDEEAKEEIIWYNEILWWNYRILHFNYNLYCYAWWSDWGVRTEWQGRM